MRAYALMCARVERQNVQSFSTFLPVPSAPRSLLFFYMEANRPGDGDGGGNADSLRERGLEEGGGVDD